MHALSLYIQSQSQHARRQASSSYSIRSASHHHHTHIISQCNKFQQMCEQCLTDRNTVHAMQD